MFYLCWLVSIQSSSHFKSFFLYQISWNFVINQVPCVSSCWGRRHTPMVCNELREPHTSHYPSRPVTKWVGGSRSKERDRKSELVLRSTYQIFEWDRNNSDWNFYNVVGYVHIPLVPWLQERSEAERRAIWQCLNVATWRRERSDRAIQQIR